MRKLPGVKINGVFSSEEIDVRGLEFRHASTRVNNDCSSLNVNTVTPITRLIRVLADFIEASQIPPKCGLTGGINFHVTI